MKRQNDWQIVTTSCPTEDEKGDIICKSNAKEEKREIDIEKLCNILGLRTAVAINTRALSDATASTRCNSESSLKSNKYGC